MCFLQGQTDSHPSALGSGLLYHVFPNVDFAPHGIYSAVGAVAVLASFKQMSFLEYYEMKVVFGVWLRHGSV